MTSEEEMEEGIVPEVMPEKQFDLIIKETGLEDHEGKFLRDNFSNLLSGVSEWSKKSKQIVVTNENQVVMMKQARVGRLFLRDIRLDVEKVRKAMKERYLKAGRAVDTSANFLKDLIIPIENYLDLQEHFVEYKKKAEDERILAEAHAKMEEERLAKEKKDAEKVAELQAELNEAKAEKEKAESALRAKNQADLKAEADKARQEAALKNAGDVEKLLKLRQDIESIVFPDVKSAESKSIVMAIKGDLYMASRRIKPIEKEEI